MHLSQDYISQAFNNGIAAVITPDHKGKNTENGFAHGFEYYCNQNRIPLIALLNGPDFNALKTIAEKSLRVSSRTSQVRPLPIMEEGAIPALLYGLWAGASITQGNKIILHADDREHDPKHVPKIVNTWANRHPVVCSLEYRDGMLGTNDQGADRFLKNLVNAFMDRPIDITHAHGYEGVPRHLAMSIARRMEIIATEAQQLSGQKIQWGGHLAAILAAENVAPYKGIRVRGDEPRFRSDEKVQAQMRAWEQICKGYVKFKNFLASRKPGSSFA